MKMFFVVPVYNVEAYLKRCVDSVLRQTYPDVRIILVDDGSKDGSPKMCDEYAAAHENISVIHKPNGGLSDARNAGLDFIEKEASDEDFVTFLDSDDFVRDDFAQIMIDLCVKNDCQMFSCEYEKGDGDAFTPNHDKPFVFVKDAEAMLLDQRMKSLSAAKVYQLSCLKDVRFPLGVWNEDEYTTYRAIYKCRNAGATTEKLYYYYQHAGSIMSNVARKMKNSPHQYDWLNAFRQRIEFFENEKKPELVRRGHEKICAECILRYCEQMYLKKEDRDDACINGEYLKIYRQSYPIAMKRKGIALTRRLMYIAFYVFPFSATLAGRVFQLRK